MSDKPPIGCMPKKLWFEERINLLNRAMDRRMALYGVDKTVQEWASEIRELIALHEKEEK